jgi:ATP-dependent DNA helicase RecQ
VGYADASGCLRATILKYFGDSAAQDSCGSCGNCDRRERLSDAARLLVRKILSGIARCGERYGRRKVTAMLVGLTDDLPEPLVRLSTTGLLQNEDPRTVERWIDAATGAGLVAVSNDEYRTLRLTPLGRDVMAGRVEDVSMSVPAARAPFRTRKAKRRAIGRAPTSAHVVPIGNGPDRPSAAPELVEALRDWRLAEARTRAIAPFIILHDRTLLAIAAARPQSAAELLQVPGIGPGKVAQYGDAIVGVVRGVG